MKGILLLIFLIAFQPLSAQEISPPTHKGKKVKIEKVFKKYQKEHKLYAVEFRYLRDYLLENQLDSAKITERLGNPFRIENNNGQTVLIYNCYVNYEVAGYWNWEEWLYLYLDDNKRVADLRSND